MYPILSATRGLSWNEFALLRLVERSGLRFKRECLPLELKAKTSLFKRISEKFKSENVATELVAPINKLSEDFSCRDIAVIMNEIQSALKNGISKIVVAHGTDTLHYSASFSEFLFRREGTRICFTGSFYPPDDPRSRARLAICAAIRTVLSSHIDWGTFVALEKADGSHNILVCNALSMKPLDIDDKGLSVRDGAPVFQYPGASVPEIKHAFISPIQQIFYNAPSQEDMQRAARLTRLLPAYPGLSGGSLEEAADNSLVYIISSYHSGTGPSADAFGGGLPTFIKRHPDKLVLLATHPELSAPYGSVRTLLDAGAIVISKLLPHQVYALTILVLAAGLSIDDLRSILKPITVRI